MNAFQVLETLEDIFGAGVHDFIRLMRSNPRFVEAIRQVFDRFNSPVDMEKWSQMSTELKEILARVGCVPGTRPTERQINQAIYPDGDAETTNELVELYPPPRSKTHGEELQPRFTQIDASRRELGD